MPGFAALNATAVAVFAVTAFAVSAALHYYYGERARLGDLEKPPELRRRERTHRPVKYLYCVRLKIESQEAAKTKLK